MFWLILTPLVFLILLWGNWGELRLYVLLGLIIGALLYLKYLSKHVASMIDRIIYAIKKLILLLLRLLSFVWVIICWPFKTVFLLITLPFGFMAKILSKIFIALKTLIKSFASKLLPPNKTD